MVRRDRTEYQLHGLQLVVLCTPRMQNVRLKVQIPERIYAYQMGEPGSNVNIKEQD